jgi:hypothetical protein
VEDSTNWSTSRDRRRINRVREFSAAVIFDLANRLQNNCLIRDSSASGAQIRLSAGQTVADGSYLISLKRRAAFQLCPVWRRQYLVGVRFEGSHVLDNSLPDHLDFLKSTLIDANLRQADHIIAHGICTRDQQLQLSLNYLSQMRVGFTNRRAKAPVTPIC